MNIINIIIFFFILIILIIGLTTKSKSDDGSETVIQAMKVKYAFDEYGYSVDCNDVYVRSDCLRSKLSIEDFQDDLIDDFDYYSRLVSSPENFSQLRESKGDDFCKELINKMISSQSHLYSLMDGLVSIKELFGDQGPVICDKIINICLDKNSEYLIFDRLEILKLIFAGNQKQKFDKLFSTIFSNFIERLKDVSFIRDALKAFDNNQEYGSNDFLNCVCKLIPMTSWDKLYDDQPLEIKKIVLNYIWKRISQMNLEQGKVDLSQLEFLKNIYIDFLQNYNDLGMAFDDIFRFYSISPLLFKVFFRTEFIFNKTKVALGSDFKPKMQPLVQELIDLKVFEFLLDELDLIQEVFD